MPTKVIPLSYVNAQWRQQLNCRTPAHLSDMSLLWLDDRLSDGAIDVRLPEAMGTLVDAPYSFRYVQGQKWTLSDAGNWGYDGASLQSFNSHKPASSFDGEVSCVTMRDGACLKARLTLRNGSFGTWKAPYLWVCVMYSLAPEINPQTWVSLDGTWQKYEQTAEQFHGPAGMRLLTAHGLTEIERLAQEGYTVNCPFRRDLLADGRRGACSRAEAECFSIVVICDDAVLIGGYDENPCTDIAVGFGDLQPGQCKSADVTIEISTERISTSS